MKKIILIFIIFFIWFQNCSKQLVKTAVPGKLPHIDRLTMFFETCESDIKKAVKVISDTKMTDNLTHLMKMDSGGRKYYLLERENLTNMIMSVTEGSYSDLILINSNGLIVYTMKDDDLFGKHVKHHFKNTPLSNIFIKSENNFFIEDVSIFPDQNGEPVIFLAFPDKTDSITRGIFIIKINTDIISSIIGNDIIISRDGRYRICKERELLLKDYRLFYLIEQDNLKDNIRYNFYNDPYRYEYYTFNYNSLSWIIISGN
jgi:hypothetical protein